MNPTRLWVAASIIAFIVFIGFVLSVPHTRDVAVTQPFGDTTTNLSPVTLYDTFKKGVHTITGSLEVPNACTIVSASATTVGKSIRVAISTQADTGVCLQLPVRVNFSATVEAPAHLPLTTTVNGSLATTTSS